MVLQPEELVRQTWIQYLHKEHQISFASLGVEKKIIVGDLTRRYDLVYYLQGIPHILFEFKSYKLKLTPDNAQQIASYNLKLKVPYLILSNGMETYGYAVSQSTRELTRLDSFPLQK